MCSEPIKPQVDIVKQLLLSTAQRLHLESQEEKKKKKPRKETFQQEDILACISFIVAFAFIRLI